MYNVANMDVESGVVAGTEAVLRGTSGEWYWNSEECDEELQTSNAYDESSCNAGKSAYYLPTNF